MFEQLIKDGLVKQKRYDNGLSVFKYSRKVFYDALWETDPLLLEARGLVLDDAGNKVIWPFTKVFNYGENLAGADLEASTPIVAPRKVNGFMASVTWHHDELLVSTTGSLDSDYVALAHKYVDVLNTGSIQVGYTYLFEICSPEDPHIIEEEEGAWLIGARNMSSGCMMSEAWLDHEALVISSKRPETFRGTFGELWEQVKTCKHEGWMVIRASTRETVCKIKSPHYLSKKFLMRMGHKKVTQMFTNKEEFLKTLDEEFYDIVHYITRWWDEEKWKATSEGDRRAVIEKYFEMEAQ
jgi:hypothetical protein